MITAQHGYRASIDFQRFNRWQTHEEQMLGLRTLSYVNSRLDGESGELLELRHAIINGAETMPGQTKRKSLVMVDLTLEWFRNSSITDSALSSLANPPGRRWVIVLSVGFASTLAVLGLPLFYRIGA